MMEVKDLERITLLAVTIFVFLIGDPYCSAEIHSIHANGEYTMSNVETIENAQDRAFTYAMQCAAEEAGIYVESYTKIINASVTQDEIKVISAHLMKLIEKRYEKVIDTDNNIHIKAYVTVEVDSDDFKRIIAKIISNDEMEKKYIDLESRMLEIEKENKLLKQKMRNGSQDKLQITTALQRNEQEFKRVAPQLNRNRIELEQLGIGNIHVNYTLQQVKDILGSPETQGVAHGPFDGSLYEYRYNGNGLFVVFADGKVVFISSSSNQGRYNTPNGVGVGDSANRLTEVYGEANRVDKHGDGSAYYIYNEVFPRLLFEVKNFTITRIMCGSIDI